jgi:hypothetical protein
MSTGVIAGKRARRAEAAERRARIAQQEAERERAEELVRGGERSKER